MGGPRRCLGDKFSLLEQRTLLLKLLVLVESWNTFVCVCHVILLSFHVTPDNPVERERESESCL